MTSKQRQPQGLTEEQIYGELYNAWLKDVHEPAGPDSQKAYRDVAERCIKDHEITMQNERVGVNMCIILSSMLQRANITKLDLYHNVIRDAGCEALSHYLREDRSLLYLNLGGNDITAVGIQSIAGPIGNHQRLQVLILGSGPGDTHVNRIDPVAARLLVEKCRASKSLKTLDLSRNPIGHGSQEVFPAIQAFLQGNSVLQVLKLADTGMSSESALGIVEALGKSGSLAHLDLSMNNLGVSVALALAKVIYERSQKTTASSLKGLALQGNPAFGSSGAQALFRSLAADKGLTTLILDNCGVDDLAIEALCQSLETNAVLQYLDIQRNYLTEVGVIELAKALVKHQALQTLILAQNRIKDEGTCALASLLELNKTLTSLDLSDTWTSDRGLIALGVALANNTTLATLKMANNHVSDDGGTAFAALLEKNRSLQNCAIKGNSIFHSTSMHISRIITRNRGIKADEIPNKLKKEVIKLHYQMYKLEEAKAELANQKAEKLKIDRAQEEFEVKFRMEEAEFRKKQKELLEQIAAADAQANAAGKEHETIIDSFKKQELAYEGEMVQLKNTYENEVKERERAEEEYRALQQQIEAQESQKAQRLEDLKKRIAEAKIDRDKWAAQTREYRGQVEIAMKRLKELEAMASVAAATKGQKKGKKGKKGKKEAKEAKGSDDIANLLGDAKPEEK